MELAQNMKQMRKEKSMSQEELAEKMYVSRQTISNWENEKSYPDIHNLILMSEVFGITIDRLIKGDVEQMKEVIHTEAINQLNRYATIMALFLIVSVVGVIPLYEFFGF